MKHNIVTRRRVLVGGACAAVLAPLSLRAQDFPSRVVRIVNGFAPGGSSDIVARVMAQKLSESLKQQVIVETRTGAGGMIANEFVAKAAPDGYTLIVITGGYPAQAAMLKKLAYDPIRDFAMISPMTFYPFVMSVTPASPFKSVPELIAYAKANPGKLNYATAGIGTLHHLSTELFNVMAGVDMTHVPFKGGTTAVTELMAGRVDVMFETMTLTVTQVQAGKLRPLAVTSAARVAALPGVPALAEFLPGYEVSSFLGLATTAGTPPAVVDRLNREVRLVLDQPDTKKRLQDLGGEAWATSPDEMRQYIEREIAKWKRVVEARKIEQQ
jgi:tripartite-type tricarboxylate transporter receptor subunit TctC